MNANLNFNLVETIKEIKMKITTGKHYEPD